jgi:hypothetical protein
MSNDNLKVLMRSGKLRSQETRSRQCGLHFIIGVAKSRTHSILIFVLPIFGFLNFVWDVWKSYFSMCKVPRRLSFCVNLAFLGPWVLGLGFLKSWKLGQNGHEKNFITTQFAFLFACFVWPLPSSLCQLVMLHYNMLFCSSVSSACLYKRQLSEILVLSKRLILHENVIFLF